MLRRNSSGALQGANLTRITRLTPMKMKSSSPPTKLRKVAPPPPPPRMNGSDRLVKRVTPADDTMGKRIRLRRVELGMSQSNLAKQLGLTFQQVQKYEKGVNRVGATRLKEIARHLNVPIGYFYGETGGTNEMREVESLLFIDATHSLRLLRAYHKIENQTIQRSVVALLESMAAVAV